MLDTRVAKHRIARCCPTYDPEIGRRRMQATQFPLVEGIEELERVLRSKQPVAVRLNVQGELPTVHDGVRVVSLEPPDVSLQRANGEVLCVSIDSIRKPPQEPLLLRWIVRFVEAISLTR